MYLLIYSTVHMRTTSHKMRDTRTLETGQQGSKLRQHLP